MKKGLKRTLIVLAILLCAYLVVAVWPRTENYAGENPFLRQTQPMLIAHGGGNREFPDNTLEAFYNAYSVDETVMMETDCSITKDGVLILSHDTTLDRKTNVTGKIADWNYNDLIAQRVDFGYTNPTDENDALCGEREHFKTDDGVEKYPTDVEYPAGVTARDEEVFLATTFEELLTAFPENYINLEIKQSGELGFAALKEALRLIEQYDAYDRVVLASFHGEIYDEFMRLIAAGEVPETFMCSPGTSGAARFYAMQLLGADAFFKDEICILQLPTEQYGLSLATKSLIKNAHRHNIAVQYWTIDDPDEMRELVELGADGIMTNYPHRLKAVYEETE